MGSVEILRDLVAINSVFPKEGRMAIHLRSELKKLGFRTSKQRVSGSRFNVFAERGVGKRAVLFYGHMDTVPIYGGWETDPLKLVRKGDKVMGIGSCDMKGGIASLLDALSKTDRSRRIKVLFCVDEENLSEGAWHAIKMNRAWFRDVYFCVSCEPAVSASSAGGANVLTMGRRGRVVMDIDVKGLSYHGAEPERGVNALNQAAIIANSISMFKLGKAKGFGKETVFVSKIEGKATSLSVPDNAHMELNVQMVPPNKNHDALRNTRVFINKLFSQHKLDKRTKVTVRIRPRKTTYIEPYVNNLSDPRIRRLTKMAKDTFRGVSYNYGSSTADDNIISNNIKIPVVIIGPKGGNEHSPGEWASVKSLENLSVIYSRIINEF